MSGLGKVPNFEPDEDFKAMIEGIFQQKKEIQPVEVVEEEKTSKKKTPTRRLKLPEPPALTAEEQEKALEKAKAEMEEIRISFLEFTEKVVDTILYGYLYNEVEKIVEGFEDMNTLITQDIDESKITKHGEADLEKLKKLRARILNDVYNKYEKGK